VKCPPTKTQKHPQKNNLAQYFNAIFTYFFSIHKKSSKWVLTKGHIYNLFLIVFADGLGYGKKNVKSLA
jgi:hypothetical protein